MANQLLIFVIMLYRQPIRHEVQINKIPYVTPEGLLVNKT